MHERVCMDIWHWKKYCLCLRSKCKRIAPLCTILYFPIALLTLQELKVCFKIAVCTHWNMMILHVGRYCFIFMILSGSHFSQTTPTPSYLLMQLHIDLRYVWMLVISERLVCRCPISSLLRRWSQSRVPQLLLRRGWCKGLSETVPSSDEGCIGGLSIFVTVDGSRSREIPPSRREMTTGLSSLDRAVGLS